MTVRFTRVLILILAFVWITSRTAAAEPITWNWSFAGETGQFVTDGEDGPTPGTYTLVDFSVTSSAGGGTLGSIGQGQYSASGFFSTPPYYFVWDGSAVAFWGSHGDNTFNWWPFDDLTSERFYFFGWDTGNVNDATKAALWNGRNLDPLAVGAVTVSPVEPAPVPEPASALLLATGLGMLIRSRCKRGRHLEIFED